MVVPHPFPPCCMSFRSCFQLVLTLSLDHSLVHCSWFIAGGAEDVVVQLQQLMLKQAEKFQRFAPLFASYGSGEGAQVGFRPQFRSASSFKWQVTHWSWTFLCILPKSLQHTFSSHISGKKQTNNSTSSNQTCFQVLLSFPLVFGASKQVPGGRLLSIPWPLCHCRARLAARTATVRAAASPPSGPSWCRVSDQRPRRSKQPARIGVKVDEFWPMLPYF